MISALVSGTRKGYEDSEMLSFLEGTQEFLNKGFFGLSITTAFPILFKICPNKVGYDDIMNSMGKIHVFVQVYYTVYVIVNWNTSKPWKI